MRSKIGALLAIAILCNSSIALAKMPSFLERLENRLRIEQNDDRFEDRFEDDDRFEDRFEDDDDERDREKTRLIQRLNLNDQKLIDTFLEKNTQRPVRTNKIIKKDLKEIPISQGTKIKLELETNSKTEVSLSADGQNIKLLNLKGFENSDAISARLGSEINLSLDSTRKINLILELPSSQDSLTVNVNGESTTIETSNLIDAEFKKQNPDYIIEAKYLTQKKVIKEQKDYSFENKDNNVSERLEKVLDRIESKKECKDLFENLKNTEFDGFEGEAEDFFKLLEANPSTTACKLGLNQFSSKKQEINKLRFENKKISFKDTAEGWFKSHVERISQRMVRGIKLFEGYKDNAGKLTGNFGPLNEVKLGELLKVALISSGNQASTTIGTEVQQNHWASGFAQTSKDLNLSISEDLSDLNRPVTRGQVLQTFAETLMIINPLDLNANKETCDYESMQNAFVDFDSNHPHSLVACIFVQDGIIKGSQGNLLLDGPTNRAEIAKILNNVLDKYVDAEEIINEIEFENDLENELDNLEEALEDELENLEEIIDNLVDDLEEEDDNDSNKDNDSDDDDDDDDEDDDDDDDDDEDDDDEDDDDEDDDNDSDDDRN